MEFKDRIRELRLEKGMTHSQLAALIERGESAVRMWEAGKSKPDMDTVLKLKEIFDCSIDYLFGFAEYKQPDESFIGRATGLSGKAIQTLINAHQTYLNVKEDCPSVVDDDAEILSYLIEMDCHQIGSAESDDILNIIRQIFRLKDRNECFFVLDDGEIIDSRDACKAGMKLVDEMPQNMQHFVRRGVYAYNKSDLVFEVLMKKLRDALEKERMAYQAGLLLQQEDARISQLKQAEDTNADNL